MKAVECLPQVHAVFDVGLLENKRHCELAVSPDGVVVLSSGEVWLLEMKTRVAVATVRSASAVRARYGSTFECVFGDDVFRDACLCTAYRMQLAHQLTVVSNAGGVVFAVASTSGLIFTAFIKANNAALLPHRQQLLKVVHRLQLGWVFANIPEVPVIVPESTALEFASHCQFFRMLRAWVVQHGCLPPVKRFKWCVL